MFSRVISKYIAFFTVSVVVATAVLVFVCSFCFGANAPQVMSHAHHQHGHVTSQLIISSAECVIGNDCYVAHLSLIDILAKAVIESYNFLLALVVLLCVVIGYVRGFLQWSMLSYLSRLKSRHRLYDVRVKIDYFTLLLSWLSVKRNTFVAYSF